MSVPRLSLSGAFCSAYSHQAISSLQLAPGWTLWPRLPSHSATEQYIRQVAKDVPHDSICYQQYRQRRLGISSTRSQGAMDPVNTAQVAIPG